MNRTKYAFFDVDETLINIKSMFSFQSFYHRRCKGPVGGSILDRQSQLRRDELISGGADRSQINAAFFKEFQGWHSSDVRAAAIEWFEQIRHTKGFFIAPTLDMLRLHQSEGVEPVFVSGSSVEILQPLADQLKVQYVLANRLEVEAGSFTGRLIPPQTIAAGKREAILSFLRNHDADPSACFGYGDHLSDLPLLEAVGYPTVIARDKDLIAVARDRGWRVLFTQSSS